MQFGQYGWRRAVSNFFAYLAPETYFGSPQRHVVAIAALLGVAAIAGAVVLAPARKAKPDFLEPLRRQIAERAEIDLFDDFSRGLDNWSRGANRANTWSYDRSGFVNVGALSLFEPTMQLDDYDVDTLVQIESKSLTLAVRASSPQTYQAVKLILDGSGPLRSLVVQRYAVVAGVPSRAATQCYTRPLHSDALWRVHLEARGDAFTLYAQDDLVDYWSEPRLSHGGVGFFCSGGERARVAWVRVSHNTGSIGRMCGFVSSLLPPRP